MSIFQKSVEGESNPLPVEIDGEPFNVSIQGRTVAW